MPKKLLLAHAALLTLALCACGQKGPLYLPQEPAIPAPPVTPAGTHPTSAAAQEEEEEKEQADESIAEPAVEK